MSTFIPFRRQKSCRAVILHNILRPCGAAEAPSSHTQSSDASDQLSEGPINNWKTGSWFKEVGSPSELWKPDRQPLWSDLRVRRSLTPPSFPASTNGVGSNWPPLNSIIRSHFPSFFHSMDLGNIWVPKRCILLTTYLLERNLSWHCSFHLGTNKVTTIGGEKNQCNCVPLYFECHNCPFTFWSIWWIAILPIFSFNSC